MDRIERIIFVGKCGNRREPMAEGIFKDCWNGPEVEVLARGLIVQFPEPMNQKAEAMLISNGEYAGAGYGAKPESQSLRDVSGGNGRTGSGAYGLCRG